MTTASKWCGKSLLVGALSGVLAMLLGASVARAADQEDVVLSEQVAIGDAQEGLRRGLDCSVVRTSLGTYEADCGAPEGGMTHSEAEAELDENGHCEVIMLADGSFSPQCDEWSYPVESAACGRFAAGYADSDQAYEACMTIALHTPGAVR